MLQLRPNCECCGRDLAPADEAYLCTFECTWCPDCVARFADRRCPNCSGNLERRPIRPVTMLAQYPPSSERVVSEGCADRIGR